MSATEIDLPQSWKCSGETVTATRITTCDSVQTLTLIVAGSTKKQAAALAVTKSLVQAFFLTSSQAITLHFNGTNEQQSVTITGSPTGGTFTLTWSGQTTSAIAYNATAATVQTALEALSNIGVGDVSVSGSAGGPYTVTFTGDLGLSDVAAMTASGAGLTGGTTPGVSIATPVAGVAPDATWSLAADSPEVWDKNGLFTNPMPGNLVNVYITNANTVSAKVQLRFGVNAS